MISRMTVLNKQRHVVSNDFPDSHLEQEKRIVSPWSKYSDGHIPTRESGPLCRTRRLFNAPSFDGNGSIAALFLYRFGIENSRVSTLN